MKLYSFPSARVTGRVLREADLETAGRMQDTYAGFPRGSASGKGMGRKQEWAEEGELGRRRRDGVASVPGSPQGDGPSVIRCVLP